MTTTVGNISWIDPTLDVNSNPLPPDTTINIFQAPSASPIGNVPLGAQAFTTGPLVTPGTYKFTLEAMDSAGNSVMTDSFGGTVGFAVPMPPTSPKVVFVTA